MLAVLLALLLVAPVQAQTNRVYNSEGKYQGESKTRPTGETRAYGPDGKYSGRSVQRPDGSSRIYNAQGKLIGTTKPRK